MRIWVYIIILFQSYWFSKARAQDISNYLYENKFNICLTDSETNEFSNQYNPYFSDKKVFLFGEFHDYNGNDDIRLFFLKYLYFNAGVRVTLEECPASYQYFVEKYFKTGSDSILNWLVLRTGTQNKENYIKKYYEFYKTLPDTAKFIYWGIDEEIYCWAPIEALSELCPDEIPPLNINKTFKSFFKIRNKRKICSKNKLLHLAENFREDILRNKEIYKNYLGLNFNMFNRIVNGLCVGLKYTKKYYHPSNMKEREVLMYNNICDVISLFPQVKLFGQTGFVHAIKDITQAKMWGWDVPFESIGSKLNYDFNSPVKNKVLTTIIYYPQYFSEELDKEINYGLLTQEGRHAIENLAGDKFTLFKICNPDSPFQEYCKWFDFILVNNIWNKK